MWVETAKASTLTFNLMVGNDFVVPDPSTNAVLTVRNRSGSVLHTDHSAVAALRKVLSTNRALVVLPAFHSLVSVDDPHAARVLRGVSLFSSISTCV